MLLPGPPRIALRSIRATALNAQITGSTPVFPASALSAAARFSLRTGKIIFFRRRDRVDFFQFSFEYQEFAETTPTFRWPNNRERTGKYQGKNRETPEPGQERADDRIKHDAKHNASHDEPSPAARVVPAPARKERLALCHSSRRVR
jgi:hypothetical protein